MSTLLEPDQYQRIGAFRCSLRQFWSRADVEARKLGIPPQQHHVLLMVAGHREPEGITIGQLTDCLALKTHTVVELVARLDEAGLLQRRNSPIDRRRILISLTDDARDKLGRLSEAHAQELRDMGPFLRERLAELQDAG